MSLYWKRMTCKGAIAGVCTGAVGTIVFKDLKTHVGGIFSSYELLPAFILSVVVTFIVSLLDKEPATEIQKEFDQTVAYAYEK